MVTVALPSFTEFFFIFLLRISELRQRLAETGNEFDCRLFLPMFLKARFAFCADEWEEKPQLQVRRASPGPPDLQPKRFPFARPAAHLLRQVRFLRIDFVENKTKSFFLALEANSGCFPRNVPCSALKRWARNCNIVAKLNSIHFWTSEPPSMAKQEIGWNLEMIAIVAFDSPRTTSPA